MGHLWLKWMRDLWQSELLFLGDMLKEKNTGLQGSTRVLVPLNFE